MPEAFTIEVSNLTYTVKSYCEVDCTFYEIFTNCEKLFTLKKGSDGVWKTNEADIIPISDDIIADIGDAIDKHSAYNSQV